MDAAEKQCGDKLEFSVLMCVYGKDDPFHFKTAVDSIWIHQTRKPDELVLVVDGPVPETIDKIVDELAQDPCCQVIRLPQNMGHGIARRIGLEHCAHDLVALMDADDISLPDRFQRQLAIYRADPALSVLGGQIEEFSGRPDQVVGRRIVPLDDDGIKAYLKKRCPFNQMTVMFRRAAVDRAGGYQDWYQNEDYWLWIRMCQDGAVFANADAVLVKVRTGEELYRRRGGMRYFQSEAGLQNYMLSHGMISLAQYAFNIGVRLVVQVILPDSVRGYVFQRLFRSRTQQ